MCFEDAESCVKIEPRIKILILIKIEKNTCYILTCTILCNKMETLNGFGGLAL